MKKIALWSVLDLGKNKGKTVFDGEKIIIKFEKLGFRTKSIWGLVHEQITYRSEIAYKIE